MERKPIYLKIYIYIASALILVRRRLLWGGGKLPPSPIINPPYNDEKKMSPKDFNPKFPN